MLTQSKGEDDRLTADPLESTVRPGPKARLDPDISAFKYSANLQR